jgi:hypothetical protein
MKSYHAYSDFAHIFQKLCGALFLLFIPVLVAGLFIRPDLLLPLISAIVVSSAVGMFQLHMFPNIEVTESGIKISFFFRQLLIAWSDIVEIKTAWFIGRSLRVVSCHRITPFHWLYGLIYGGTSIYPSFLVSSRIEDFDKLMREIKSQIGHDNVQDKS